MRLLPLILSVHPSVWSMEVAAIGQGAASSIFRRDRNRCRFCGQSASALREIVCVDGDRTNVAVAGNLATACIVCAAAWGLHRPSAALEVLPVWLPEMSQRALNVLVRGLHVARLRCGVSAAPENAAGTEDPGARRPSECFARLAKRADVLRERTGVSLVADLPDLFLRADPDQGRCPEGLLHGLRLLHRGRHFVGGTDVYPKLLAMECGARVAERAA